MTMAGVLKGTPTFRVLTAEQVSTSGAGLMVMAQVVVATTPLASVTFTVKLPASVGVPVIAPVVVFRVRPAGRVPGPKVGGAWGRGGGESSAGAVAGKQKVAGG